jgi:hypothetical protein
MAKAFLDHFDLFVEDFLGEKSFRPMLIVGASKIDDLLLRILQKHLVSIVSGAKDEFLEGDNPLGTFSARIKLTHRLGIIDTNFYKLLEQVRKIRNLSAHGIDFDINKSPIKEHLHELQKGIKGRNSYNLTKQRYFNNAIGANATELQCTLLTICVILQAILEKINQTTGIKETLLISIK